MSVLGIDFGASGAVMCVVKKGALDTVLNEASKRKTPALISYYNGQRYIGEPAAGMEGSNFKNTVKHFKTLIGKKFDSPEAQREIARMPNRDRYSKAPNDGYIQATVMHDEKELALDVTAMISTYMGGLKRTAERTLTENNGGVHVAVKDCVISVPPHFTDAERRQILDAAQVADLNVLSLMNESTAVALDYGMWKNARNVFDAEKPTVAMFVDVGYVASTVTIVSYVKGKLQVKACTWDRDLGGRNIDEAIVERFAAEFQAKTKLDVRKDGKAMIKLRNVAEKAKQTLTPDGVTKAEVNVEYLMNETDYRSFLATEDLDAIVLPWAQKLIPVIEQALKDAGMKPADVGVVEVVGGSARMRQFKKAIASTMGLDASKGPNYGVLTTLNADESVARGCALQCAMLSPQFKIAVTFEVVDLVPYPIKVIWDQPPEYANKEPMAVEDGGKPGGTSKTSVALLKRGDEAPKVRRITFKRQEAFEVHAYYDEDPSNAPSSRLIGSFKIQAPVPPPKANAEVQVDFSYNRSGLFSVQSASVVEDAEEEAASGAKEAKGTPATMEGSGESGEANAPVGEAAAAPAAAPPVNGGAEKKTTRKRVRRNLGFTSNTSSLSESEITKRVARENELLSRDRALKERADCRNALEEFVYSAKDAMDGSLKEFATEQERASLLEALAKEESWVYDEGDTATTQQFTQHLKTLRTMYDKINNRNLEIEARRIASEKASALVDSYLQVANSTSEAYAHLSDEERASLRKECEEFTNWITAQHEKQASLPLNKDPTFTAAVIDEKAAALREKCRPIAFKPKPKPPKEDPPPTSGSSASSTPQPPGSASSTPAPEGRGEEEKKSAEGEEADKKEGDEMELD